MPAIRALILDFDGLVLETEGACFGSWQALFAAHGQRYTLADFLPIVGTHNGANDPRRLLEQRSGRTFDWERLENERRATERRLGAALAVQPGVAELIAAARTRDLKLAVASSSSHAWVDDHLRERRLFTHFETTVCRGDAPRVKPDPDLYHEALRRLGVAANEAIAFEDSHHGSLAAKRAGLWCVAVPTAITQTQDFSHVDLRVSTLAGLDLEQLLARFENPP